MSALLAYVSTSDLRVAGRIRGWNPSPWFCRAMVAATRFGDGWGWAALVPLLAASGPRARAALGAAAAAAAVSVAAFTLLKHAFRRPRPCVFEPHPLFDVRPPDRFSFPSGHTMTSFAAATVLGLQFPFAAPALALLAVAVGASRVVLGLHYVSDVVAGALLGTLAGASAWVALA